MHIRALTSAVLALTTVLAVMASPAGAYESVVASWQETGNEDEAYQPANHSPSFEPQGDSWLSNCAWNGRPQSTNPWYLGVFGGWNFVPPLETDLGFAFPFEIFMNDGGLVGLSLGRELSDFYRVEAEVVYRRNSVENVSPSVGQEFSGHVNNLGVMTNVYRDFGTARLRPYIGGGLGVSYVDILTFPVFDPSNTFVAYDTMFAFQGMAGLKYELTSRISLYSEYRYFGTTGIGIDYGIPAVAEATYNAHSVIMGLQLRR